MSLDSRVTPIDLPPLVRGELVASAKIPELTIGDVKMLQRLAAREYASLVKYINGKKLNFVPEPGHVDVNRVKFHYLEALLLKLAAATSD